MNPFFRKALVLFSGVIWSVSCFAQLENSWEEILFMEIPRVTTATLNDRNILTAPSTMDVITEERIEASGAWSLMEILETIPGITVKKNRWGFELITLRGISPSVSNDKITLAVNGHPISEVMWNSFSIFYDIPLENVKQIEIMRGPASFLYGTNAFSGVINVITKKAADIDGAALDVKVGAFDAWSGDLSYGTMLGDLEIALNLNHYRTDGPSLTLERDGLFPAPFSAAPAEMTEAGETSRIFLDLKYGNFRLQTAYTDSESQSPIGQSFLTQDEETKYYEFGYIEASYDFPVSDTLEIRTKVSFDRMDYHDAGDLFPYGFTILQDVNGDGVPDPVDVDGDGRIETWPEGIYTDFGFTDNQVRTEILFDWQSAESNRFLLGVFYETYESEDVYAVGNAHPIYLIRFDAVSDLSHPSLVWNKQADREVYGAFFQDEWYFTPEWYLIFGTRYDHYDDFGSSVSPRAGLVWDTNRRGGVFKLTYGSAFKAPNFTQLYNQNNPSLVGNPDLDAETLESIEFSWHNVFRDQWHLGTNFYYLETEDLIDRSETRDFTLPLGPQFYENRGETEVYGAEIRCRYSWGYRNYLFATYDYTHAENMLTESDVPWVPEHQANLGVNLFLNERFNWNLEMDYTGERPREYGDPRTPVKDHVVLNTTLRFEQKNGWDVYVRVENLTDEDVVAPSTVALYPQSDMPRPGTTWLAGASVKI
jgi:iron complex outermembrane receptor protein